MKLSKKNCFILLLLIPTFIFCDNTKVQAGQSLWLISSQLADAQIATESCKELISSDIDNLSSQIEVTAEAINSTIDLIATQTTRMESKIDAIPRTLFGLINTSGPAIIRGSDFTITSLGFGRVRVNITTPFTSPPYVVSVINNSLNGNPVEVSNVTASTFDLTTYTTTVSLGQYSHVPSINQAYFMAFGH